MRVAFYSQGCRLNHSEIATLNQQFSRAGYTCVPLEQVPDIVVINTCTVTENGDRDTRRLVHRIVRQSGDVKIALIGCQSQILKDKLTDLPAVQWVIGNADKMRLVSIIQTTVTEGFGAPVVIVPAIPEASFSVPITNRDQHHVRANIKVQDGCNFYCSFCIIPFARGPARSRVFSNLLAEAHQLVMHGHYELVLTGINMGTYSDSGHTLVAVLDAMEKIPGLCRIRLSSIEPTTIDDRIFSRLIDTNSKVCRYAHIPVQSGCDATLKRMRRKYSMASYRHQIEKIMQWNPDVCIGTDVIVGFPGESEAEFMETYSNLEQLPLAYFHVFPYSERQMAHSRKFENPVAQPVIQARAKRLRILSAQKKAAYCKRYVGQSMGVLIEQKKEYGWLGHTDNFISVCVPVHSTVARNTLVSCQLTHYDSETGLMHGVIDSSQPDGPA
tara:strand:+ start:1225 stop:2547 length:1323 start_codon:yes stop_codon:yes gene_type:complete